MSKRKPLTELGKFISDTLDEEDPQGFIKAGASPGHYRSFVEDIMVLWNLVKSEGQVLVLIHTAFVKGFLPAVRYDGDKRTVVTENTTDDYEMAMKLAGGSEPYEGAAKKIWAYVTQTKKD